MRGTFYLRSITFYHHMSEMRNCTSGTGEPPEVVVDQPIQSAGIHDDPEISTSASEVLHSLSPVDDAHNRRGINPRINPKSCSQEINDNEYDQFGPQQADSKSGSPVEDDGRSRRLLPSLPNDMTIDHILTKVPWTALFFTLPAVSSAWRRAIRSHQVHEARFRTHTTQGLVAIIHQTLVRKIAPCGAPLPPSDSEEFEHALAISLYDPSLDRWYLLPTIEGVDRGIPYACECMCLEGRVYIIGGYSNFCPTKAVYVLDLAAGLALWRRCASMRSARVGFSGGAMDGKIFIFGGTRSSPFEMSSECLEAEVFDPKRNTWTCIAPTLRRHTGHCVACVEEEFIVHGGRCWSDMDSDDDTDRWLHDNNRIAGRMAEAYDPSKNEWHEIENFALGIVGAPVVVDGKLHVVSERDSCVYAYDKQRNSWESSQGISWQGLGGGFERNTSSSSAGRSSNVVIEATAWEGEILAAMCWWNVARFRSGVENWEDQIVLLKSRGLGCRDRDLEWKRIASADAFHEQILCMRSIQL